MSARVESTPVRESPTRPIVIAIVAAVSLAALAVGTVRFAFDDDRPAAATSVQAPLWDAQKLEAMEGRVLAERVATSSIVVPALEPGELKAILEGRGTVEQVGAQSSGWDAQKLEAMEGRVLAERFRAEQVGAEDPILAPHVPRRAPQE
jgi:hypothetical protein